MNIRILSKVWIFLVIGLIQVNVNDAFWGSFVKGVKNVATKLKEKFHPQEPAPAVSAQSSSNTIANAICPTTERYISVQDSLDAAWASKVAYADSSQVDDIVADTNYVIEDIIYSDDDNLKAFVAESSVNGQPTRIISFRGTKTAMQLTTQVFKGLANVKKNDHEVQINGRKVRVLTFITNAYNKLINGIKDYLDDPNFKYIITGHSMGGSVASLFALKAKIDYPNVWEHPESCLITFGAPRLGDTAFANLHDDLICPDRKIRIVYRADPAPHAVFTLGDGASGNDFKHHSREVWFTTLYYLKLEKKKKLWHSAPVNPALKICANLDPSDCSNSLSGWERIKNIRHHDTMNYINSLKSIPLKIYDKYGAIKDSWMAALTSSND